MGVDFIAGKPTDLLGISEWSSASGSYDSNYTSGSIFLLAPYGSLSEPLEFTFPKSTGSRWVHFEVQFDSTYFITDSDADGYWFSIYDENDDLLVRVEANNGYFTPKVYGDTTESAPDYFILTDERQIYDMQLIVDASTITFKMFRDNLPLTEVSAPNTGGKTQATKMILDHYDIAGTSNANQRGIYYSQIIASSEDTTLGMKLAEVPANSIGDYNEWDGDLSLAHDNNLATGITSDAVGQRVSWSINPSNVPQTTTILGVAQSGYALTGDGGPQSLSPFLRIGSTDHDGLTFPAQVSRFSQIWAENPETSLPWEVSDLATLEVGMISKT